MTKEVREYVWTWFIIWALILVGLGIKAHAQEDFPELQRLRIFAQFSKAINSQTALQQAKEKACTDSPECQAKTKQFAEDVTAFQKAKTDAIK